MTVRKGASADAENRFTTTRDQAVMIGQLVQALSIEQIEEWIEQGERALSLGPILHPSEFQHGGGELQKQLTYMRAVLAFRRAVAETIGATV